MVSRTQRSAHIGGEQLPLITPDSDWAPPTELPDLRNVPRIALDTEGKDEWLTRDRGSGWPYRGGYVAGVSVAWEGGAFYAPVRHPETQCIDYNAMGRWIEDHKRAGVRFVTHHGSHDWGWIQAQWGIAPPASDQLDDTEAMAMMVDENRLSYRLDALCQWQGVPGKDERALREAAACYGVDAKAELWKLPARYVGPYAEQDAVALLPLADKLLAKIREEETYDAYRLEMDIFPTVLEMRRRGIRIDLDRAKNLKIELTAARDAALRELGEHLGRRVSIDDCRSNKTLIQWFTQHKIPFSETATGMGSFQAKWMRKHAHWLPRLVARAEQLTEAAEKFVQGFILDFAHNGRLHAHINQYRGEEGGTRSFRFSYGNPPLQQMPARDEELADAIRGLFLPEKDEVWAALDYSQQEYRLIVHYAYLLECTKALDAVMQYRENPDTDFHVLVSEWTGLERKPAKDTNFAKAFGAGIPKFASMIGKSKEEAEKIYKQYDRELPFVSEAATICKNRAATRGFIRLADGTRSHFDQWEPRWREQGEGYTPPGPREYAERTWPGRDLRRAYTHKAFNRLIQGTAARMTKAAIRNCAREGMIPLIQMHDELGFSCVSDKQTKRLAEIMRSALPLEVPMKVDIEVGASWGTAKGDPSKHDWPRVSSTEAAPDTHTGWYNRERNRQNKAGRK